MIVALFDIDGTLLSTGGAGRRAMEASLREHFGTRGPDGYAYGGKTDRQIARETMRLEGFTDAEIDARLPAVVDGYLRRLADDLARDPAQVRVYDGVRETLDTLEARDDVVLGLLTGNVVPGAELKLRTAGIAIARFRVGAFGTDHEERPALPAIAQARATALLGRPVPGDRVVVIGDTPHDMTCGQGIGARAIGVTTGGYDHAALAAHAPHAVFADLRDTTAVVRAVVGA